VSRSYCLRLAAHRGVRAKLGQRRGGVARARKSQRGGARVAAGLEAMHRGYQNKRWRRQHGSDGEQLRCGGRGEAARADGRASWHARGGPAERN
jgi:hypothetical protein